jgi:hypothetical protein
LLDRRPQVDGYKSWPLLASQRFSQFHLISFLACRPFRCKSSLMTWALVSSPGDRVILSPATNIANGMRIREGRAALVPTLEVKVRRGSGT